MREQTACQQLASFLCSVCLFLRWLTAANRRINVFSACNHCQLTPDRPTRAANGLNPEKRIFPMISLSPTDSFVYSDQPANISMHSYGIHRTSLWCCHQSMFIFTKRCLFNKLFIKRKSTTLPNIEHTNKNQPNTQNAIIKSANCNPCLKTTSLYDLEATLCMWTNINYLLWFRKNVHKSNNNKWEGYWRYWRMASWESCTITTEVEMLSRTVNWVRGRLHSHRHQQQLRSFYGQFRIKLS